MSLTDLASRFADAAHQYFQASAAIVDEHGNHICPDAVRERNELIHAEEELARALAETDKELATDLQNWRNGSPEAIYKRIRELLGRLKVAVFIDEKSKTGAARKASKIDTSHKLYQYLDRHHRQRLSELDELLRRIDLQTASELADARLDSARTLQPSVNKDVRYAFQLRQSAETSLREYEYLDNLLNTFFRVQRPDGHVFGLNACELTYCNSWIGSELVTRTKQVIEHCDAFLTAAALKLGIITAGQELTDPSRLVLAYSANERDDVEQPIATNSSKPTESPETTTTSHSQSEVNVGQFTSDAAESESECGDDLSDKEQLILREMLSAGAIRDKAKLTQAEIVEKCQKYANPVSWKRDFSRLGRRGYTASVPGNTGGMWLTALGKTIAASLQ